MDAPGSSARRFRVAGFWRRLCAALVDAVVLVPTMLLFAVVTASVGGRQLHSMSELGPSYPIELALEGGAAGWAALGMAGVVAFLYLVVFHATSGQTPGERLLRLRVIDPWGERPSLLRAAARTAAGFLALALAGLGLLWAGFDREKRGLHDWLAGTYVVLAAWKESPASAPAQTAEART